MSDTPPDPSAVCAGLCPLCGQDNRCALEAQRRTGQPQPACWCVDARFSPELLARVPEAARRKACICQACASVSPA